jgi:hypothetical protein
VEGPCVLDPHLKEDVCDGITKKNFNQTILKIIKTFLVLLCGRMNSLFLKGVIFYRRKIRLIEGYAKFLRLKVKSDLQKDSAAAGYLSEAPSASRFLFWGWVSNFAGSESGHIQSIKLLQNMVSNTQHPPTHPLPATHCLAYTLKLGGGNWK